MTTLASRSPKPATDQRTRRFVFLLLERFTMLSFASAVEPLRIANRMAGREVYSWTLIGEGGGVVRCSAGIPFALDAGLIELERDDVLVVCGGIDVQKATTKPIAARINPDSQATIHAITDGGVTPAPAANPFRHPSIREPAPAGYIRKWIKPRPAADLTAKPFSRHCAANAWFSSTRPATAACPPDSR